LSELQTTQPTVEQRAVIALGFSEQKEKALMELAKSTCDIVTITNAAGRMQVHTARMRLKSERLEIEKLALEKRDDANKFRSAVIALEKRLVAIVGTEEDRLQKVQDAWDDKIEAEKQAKIAAEFKRVTDIQARVEALRGNLLLTPTHGSALIQDHIYDIEAIVVDESFQEFRLQATDAKAAGIARLQGLLAAAIDHEAQQAKIKADLAELARLRAAEDERQAAAKLAQAEQERVQRAEREAAEAKQAAELKAARDAQEAELKAQREANEAAAKLERERIAQEEAAAKVIRDAEAKKLADERAALELAKAIEAAKAREAEAQAEIEYSIRAERERIAMLEKPSDEAIISVLASHYSAPREKVIEWLHAMNWAVAP